MSNDDRPINLDIAIREVSRSWGQWCNDYRDRLNDITVAHAALTWAIVNGAYFDAEERAIKTVTGKLPTPDTADLIDAVIRSQSDAGGDA